MHTLRVHFRRPSRHLIRVHHKSTQSRTHNQHCCKPCTFPGLTHPHLCKFTDVNIRNPSDWATAKIKQIGQVPNKGLRAMNIYCSAEADKRYQLRIGSRIWGPYSDVHRVLEIPLMGALFTCLRGRGIASMFICRMLAASYLSVSVSVCLSASPRLGT